MIKEKASFSYWIERVYIETTDHIILGDVYVSASCGTNRGLSEFLNSDKKFIVVKNCKVEYKNYKSIREIEEVDFMQININSILMVKHPPENL